MNPQYHLTPLKQLQGTLAALRELYNNRNAVNTNLPWGQLDGCCFGVAELQGLLTKVHREVSRINNHDAPGDRAADVTRRIHEAMTSTDPFARWQQSFVGRPTSTSRARDSQSEMGS
jgi:hypothetical protein